MDLKFDPSVNKAHEKWAEQESKRVREIKNAQIEKEEREYYINRGVKKVAIGLLVAAGLTGLIVGAKLVDDKLIDNVYETYGQSDGTMRHPETHELEKYWEIDGKVYFLSDLKWKAIFNGPKSNKDSSLVTDYTPRVGESTGETKPLGGK